MLQDGQPEVRPEPGPDDRSELAQAVDVAAHLSVSSRKISSSDWPASVRSMRLELLHRAAGDQPALVDDADPVAQLLGHLHDVGREEERLALVAVLAEQLLELMGRARVEPDERLVEDHDPGRREERRRQHDLLLHAVRVALDGVRDRRGQLEGLEPLADALEPLRLGHAVDVADEVEVLEAGQPLVDRRVVGDVGRQLLGPQAVRGHVVPLDDDAPRVRPQQPDDHLDGRRLAGAVRPQEAEDLARLDGERQIVDGFDLAAVVAFRNVRQFDHVSLLPLVYLIRRYFTSIEPGASGILRVIPAASSLPLRTTVTP